MASLRKTFADLARQRWRWDEIQEQAARASAPSPKGRLRLLETFGPNPAHLSLHAHVPAGLAAGAPLVVVLHGCTQTAAGYDAGSGWSRLADEAGFAVAFPQQNARNNGRLCFDWFDPRHVGRGDGEVRSIAAMIGHMVETYRLDRRRVFITGLSAGGAMTAAMLATYPELFAAGAVIAGLPFGTAHNVQEAFESMREGRRRPASEWGRLVREASPHAGPWPAMSIWHGTADATVNVANATDLVKQWTNVHGLPEGAGRDETAAGGLGRRVWRDGSGALAVEEILVPGMGHGTPIDGSLDGGEHAVPFMLDVGISSTRRIARRWGIWTGSDEATRRPADFAGPKETSHAANAQPALSVGQVIDRALRRAGLK
jgi:poly(hydroxyalkanoate) depolymerase family esterase